ncbi:MAG: hypothetical protein CMO54_01780 [Verrucomicrobiales bacterium]|nr:hypothetical protein [Verrucomicrobiales bacterium]MDC0065980.1 ABC transporter permease [Verrucomicrobiota bacterium]
MIKNFSLFLALRYLKPKRTYVSIITLISIIGVALGVGVLIVVIAVMTGFEKRLEDLILGFEPHLRIEQFGLIDSEDPNSDAARWDLLMEKVSKINGVKSVDPYVMGQVLLQFGNENSRRQSALMMMGVDSSKNTLTGRIKEIVDQGDLDLSYQAEEGKFGCLVSLQFAERNGIRLGEHIEAFSTADIEPIVTDLFEAADNNNLDDDALRDRVRELTESIKTPKDLIVTGIFDSVRYGEMILVPLEIGQDLYELGTDVHGLSVELDDPFIADIVNRESINEIIPTGWQSQTWIERNKQLFATIRNERGMMYFVLFFIILVAAFSTMNTMITVTVQKRHEIGVMKALGAKISQIVGVFIGQGLIVGFIGSISGLAAGSLVLYYRNAIRGILSKNLGVEIFPEEMYGVAEIPAQIIPSDITIICLGAFVLCTLAALPPAYMVARLDPAKALRD